MSTLLEVLDELPGTENHDALVGAQIEQVAVTGDDGLRLAGKGSGEKAIIGNSSDVSPEVNYRINDNPEGAR